MLNQKIIWYKFLIALKLKNSEQLRNNMLNRYSKVSPCSQGLSSVDYEGIENARTQGKQVNNE